MAPRPYHSVYKTRAQAHPDIFFYIEGFYNRKKKEDSVAIRRWAASARQLMKPPIRNNR